MKPEHPDLWLIEHALKSSNDLTPEQVSRLERCRDSMKSNLLSEASRAFDRGDKEVGMALAKAFCEKFYEGQPSVAEALIYCRVSSLKQSLNSGLWRQMRVCQEYAESRHYAVVGVFSEVASGVDALPVRATVERIAAKRGCLILCENYDRWSRNGLADAPPENVIMTSHAAQELDRRLAELLTPKFDVIEGGVQ